MNKCVFCVRAHLQFSMLFSMRGFDFMESTVNGVKMACLRRNRTNKTRLQFLHFKLSVHVSVRVCKFVGV